MWINLKSLLLLGLFLASPFLQAASSTGGSFIHSLLQNRIIILFLIIAIGLSFGKLKFKNISLGSSAVIFVALIFGHFGYKIPESIGAIGLVLFMYSVGIGAGPSFFKNLARQGSNLAKTAIIMTSIAAITTVVMARLFHIPVDLAAGLFAGALTSTPALAAAIDTLQELGPLVSVGYGIAYPFGVLAVVFFIQMLPKIIRKDFAEIAAEIESTNKDDKRIIREFVRVLNPAIIGKPIIKSQFLSTMHCRVSHLALRHSLVPIQYDSCFEEGQTLLVTGEVKNVESAIEYIGKKSIRKLSGLFLEGGREVIVSSQGAIGETFKSLGLLKKHGVIVTKITRHEVTFVPSSDTVIEKYDVLNIAGNDKEFDKVTQLLGHKKKLLFETDLVSLIIGLLLGIILGSMPISIAGGQEFKLGLAGGPLFMGLLLGHFGKIGIISSRIPVASRNVLMEMGLVFFLANAGIKAGGAFIATVEQYGLMLFVTGALITTMPIIMGYLLQVYYFKANVLEATGGICGGMTSTPALATIKSKTDSEIPVISYAAAYPIALIIMIVLSQFIIRFLM